jgi:leucyl/phenylalanyl-tRNA--protein transferase
MPIFSLNKEIVFPPVNLADPDGLLAIGGDLSIERLRVAYRAGIFPWYESDHILWWSPDPRFVLFPDELVVSKSMRSVIKKNLFSFTTNRAFSEVITNCKRVSRKDQDGTWITDEVKHAYSQCRNMARG